MPDVLKENPVTHSRECTTHLPRGQRALIFFHVISDVQLGTFFLSGHRPTAKIPHLPLSINTQSLGREARPTRMDTILLIEKLL